MDIDQTNFKNQQIILDILEENNRSMLLLDLKKISKLANLFFFKALDTLEKQKVVEKKREGNSVIVTLIT